MPRKAPFWWREPAEVERRKKYMKEWAEKNPGRKKENFANWRSKNADHDKSRCLEWQKKNPARRAANVAKYFVARRSRVPKWADLEAIATFYELAKKRTEETGIAHEVDHIYPMNGKTVSGLHVAENLQVLTAQANRSKGNRVPNHPSL